MNVLFYLLDGDTNASSWHRVLQYFPLLRANGIEPTASRPVPRAVYERLVERGGRGMASKLGFYGLFLTARLRDVLRATDYDAVVVQRDLFPFGPPLLERLLRRRARRLVYDTDDATYLRPSFTPNTPMQRLRRFDKVAEVVRTADRVSVATEPIAAWARQHNQRVDVVPMAVDVGVYERARGQPRIGDGPLVIGWAGTAGGLRYLEQLAPVLRELSQRHALVVRVVSGGHRFVQLPGVRVDARPWRAATALEDLAGFDVGVVPLDDTPFEQAKFPFKLLQYLALGVPAVAARVGVAAQVVEDGHNGLLAGSPDEWRDKLEQLIGDVELRRRLGEAGRRTVAEQYTLERVGTRLVDGLRAAGQR